MPVHGNLLEFRDNEIDIESLGPRSRGINDGSFARPLGKLTGQSSCVIVRRTICGACWNVSV
jgi:hypothetical protein